MIRGLPAMMRWKLCREHAAHFDGDDRKDEPKVYAVSIIAYGMTVNGDASVLGDLELLGSMKGNIDSEGNVMISGRLVGDIHCKKNVVLKSAAVRGNIYASGTVTIDKDTAVVGDITGRSASIDGRVKGNLIFDETVFIQKDAVFIGDVTANKVAMNEGTQIVGYIKINVEAITSVEFEEVLF
jgi:cytoskeletal protein CcmA (bactofilin family)